MTELASHLGVFLREHLPRDRNASRHTVQSYADSFQLLVCFAAERLRVRPCRIEIEQLTAPLILDFLDSLARSQRAPIARLRGRTGLRPFRADAPRAWILPATAFSSDPGRR